jgi:dolichyl-phosphate beta-glucosyltransferase
MVCGSRAGRRGMPALRRFLSCLFRLAVRIAGVSGVRDTQCGFKLFRMDAMRPVFEAQKIERFAFDVELIRLVRLAGGTVAEVPVEWRGGSRSSLRVVSDAPRMLWDLARLRFGARPAPKKEGMR